MHGERTLELPGLSICLMSIVVWCKEYMKLGHQDVVAMESVERRERDHAPNHRTRQAYLMMTCGYICMLHA
jgi:hypothetical protein